MNARQNVNFNLASFNQNSNVVVSDAYDLADQVFRVGGQSDDESGAKLNQLRN